MFEGRESLSTWYSAKRCRTKNFFVCCYLRGKSDDWQYIRKVWASQLLMPIALTCHVGTFVCWIIDHLNIEYTNIPIWRAYRLQIILVLNNLNEYKLFCKIVTSSVSNSEELRYFFDVNFLKLQVQIVFNFKL